MGFGSEGRSSPSSVIASTAKQSHQGILYEIATTPPQAWPRNDRTGSSVQKVCVLLLRRGFNFFLSGFRFWFFDGQILQQVYHAVGVTPLVVVPAKDVD